MRAPPPPNFAGLEVGRVVQGAGGEGPGPPGESFGGAGPAARSRTLARGVRREPPAGLAAVRFGQRRKSPDHLRRGARPTLTGCFNPALAALLVIFW